MVHQGDDSTDIARVFASEHGLPSSMVSRLARLVDQNVALNRERNQRGGN